MKITIEFNDEYEARMALDGRKWLNLAWEMDQELRNEVKYRAEDDASNSPGLAKAREILRELMADAGLTWE